MSRKTLVITHQSTLRDPDDNPKGTQVGYTVTIKAEQEYLQKKIDKVLKTGQAEYLETEQKTTLVVTRALLENSLVYFID